MSDDRRSVKTYVPAEQKSRWQAHADELGMSQSEFVRTMVQAGRRGFLSRDTANSAEPSPKESNPRGDTLKTRIEAILSEGPHSWEELVDAVVGDFEAQLETQLDELQDQNRVRYSGRQGGYTLTDE